MMIAPNSLVSQKKRAQREEEEQVEGWSNRISDARRGRSHRFFSVKGAGCEEQEKTWTVVWGSTLQDGQTDSLVDIECQSFGVFWYPPYNNTK